MLEALFLLWDRAWQAIGAAAPGDKLFRSLSERYQEPHRAYHNLAHIADCLGQIELTRHLTIRPAEVMVAAWFHDAIYDPRCTDNEDQSARLAMTSLMSADIDGEVAHRIGELVRSTTHDQAGLSGDKAILCDADLAILGAGTDRFDAYELAIRREYDWVPEDVYRRERGKVLARFFDRPTIYHSAFFQEKLERAARFNLERALARYRL